MGWTSRFRALSVGDYPRLATAVALLLVIDLAVVVLPFARFRNGLVRAASTLGAVVPGTPSATRIVWAVEVADAKLPGERTCLVRSLTAEVLLLLYDIRPSHRIGVHPDDGLEAHSWLELDGDVVIGDLEDLSRYEPLPPLDDHPQS